MYVVPSSSSAPRNSTAPWRVAGLSPTTPISASTRTRPDRLATRVTSSARLQRRVRAPMGRCFLSGLRQKPADGGFELLLGDGALELRLDPPVSTDEKHPRLGWELPFLDPPVHTERRVVLLVDLDVDERDTGDAASYCIDDVDDRPACSALAELRRRKDDDERLLARQSVRHGDPQELGVRRVARRQLGGRSIC